MLKNNEVKKKIREGKAFSMIFLQSTDPTIAEALAVGGVDIICIDNEHGCFSSEQIVNICRAVNAHGKCCLLRTTNHDTKAISHFMDCGVDGIFATVVDDAADCQRVIDGVKYAPIGKRGVCYHNRTADFGQFDFDSVDQYLNWCNDSTIIMVDVESKSAIDDLDAIVALDQLDVVHTGPWDLASAYGHPGHPEHPDVQAVNSAAHQKIIARTGLTCMGAGSPEDIRPEAIDRGYKCIHLGMETDYIVKCIKACQAKIDAYNNERF